jgi:hypothetical protein
MKKEDVVFLAQLADSLEEAEKSLEKSYKKLDFENFTKAKATMMSIQKEISGAIK